LLHGLALAQSKSGDGKTPPPPPEKSGAPQAPPPNPISESGAPVDPASYVIGPEDILSVRVWREPDFTGQHTVRPDGKITLPLVGDMQASGLTPERLASQTKQALSEYLNDPQVDVTIAQVNSKKYYVSGEINRPGQYPLVVPTKVFDALNNAGGFRDFANKKDIVIVRGDQRIKFNYNEVVNGKKLDQNILLQNGDTILVK
jgi:polysaccharide export outer membrane protein